MFKESRGCRKLSSYTIFLGIQGTLAIKELFRGCLSWSIASILPDVGWFPLLINHLRTCYASANVASVILEGVFFNHHLVLATLKVFTLLYILAEVVHRSIHVSFRSRKLRSFSVIRFSCHRSLGIKELLLGAVLADFLIVDFIVSWLLIKVVHGRSHLVGVVITLASLRRLRGKVLLLLAMA